MTELKKQLMKWKQNQQLTEQIALLTEQFKLLTQKLYGRSSEKSPAIIENQISLFTDEDLNLFNEAEVQANAKISEPEMLDVYEFCMDLMEQLEKKQKFEDIERVFKTKLKLKLEE